PVMTLHALRHTHASQLIAAGLDVAIVGRHLGHGNPAITLTVFARLFGDTSGQTAKVVRASLGAALTESDLNRWPLNDGQANLCNKNRKVGGGSSRGRTALWQGTRVSRGFAGNFPI